MVFGLRCTACELKRKRTCPTNRQRQRQLAPRRLLLHLARRCAAWQIVNVRQDMKALVHIIASLASFSSVGYSDINKEIEYLPPFVVSTNPFGYIGIKRATVVCHPWKFVTFQRAVRFVRIDEIYPESPATRAGVVIGDQIVGINGIPIPKWSMHELNRLGNETEVGRRISAEIVHPSNGTLRKVEVIVAKKPKEPNKSPEPPPGSVNPVAGASVAPPPGAAH
jgi:membrane-associated protease RseP (regulator of RpoE activity)